jgi:hypothetical protein
MNTMHSYKPVEHLLDQISHAYVCGLIYGYGVDELQNKLIVKFYPQTYTPQTQLTVHIAQTYGLHVVEWKNNGMRLIMEVYIPRMEVYIPRIMSHIAAPRTL